MLLFSWTVICISCAKLLSCSHNSYIHFTFYPNQVTKQTFHCVTRERRSLFRRITTPDSFSFHIVHKNVWWMKVWENMLSQQARLMNHITISFGIALLFYLNVPLKVYNWNVDSCRGAQRLQIRLEHGSMLTCHCQSCSCTSRPTERE